MRLCQPVWLCRDQLLNEAGQWHTYAYLDAGPFIHVSNHGGSPIRQQARRRVALKFIREMRSPQFLRPRHDHLELNTYVSRKPSVIDIGSAMSQAPVDEVEKCPVDHKTREKWLEAAKAKGQSVPKHALPTTSTPQVAHRHIPPHRFSLDRGHWEFIGKIAAPKRLGTDREVSTIPRALNQPTDKPLNQAELAALPANSERESGHDSQSGNWVYPSQEMFFNAMRRKGHEANAGDMSSIVPIHNAVNERAWAEIKVWEAGQGSEKCGGPKLVSFSGDSKALTPKARWNQLVGYNPPFDRHDWVIDRCGTRIDYVIDFYSGKGGQGLSGLNFYLDVRPKLNSWEGIKLRAMKAIGI